MKVNDLYEKHIRHLVLNARDLPEARCPARRMLVNARSDVITQVEVALPTLLPVRKLGRMQGGGEGPLHSKQDGGCVFPAFVQVVHHHLFSWKLFLFFFFDRQNTYSCKSDLFANFSAVYIFPCTLNGDIPYFLLQLAVADDVGHLILFECASLSWAFLLLHF